MLRSLQGLGTAVVTAHKLHWLLSVSHKVCLAWPCCTAFQVLIMLLLHPAPFLCLIASLECRSYAVPETQIHQFKGSLSAS